MSAIENLKPNQHKTQGFLLAPPQLNTRKWKAPDNCNLSFIDQGPDDYGSAKLVRAEPRKTSDIYFIVRTFKDSVGSYRRNYSHRNIALFRTKKDGPTRGNIEYLTCSFVELDGSSDNTIKTQGDVQVLIEKNNLPEPSYVIETSRGNFHVIWNYTRPLPWTKKFESYWLAQQKRLTKLFQKSGFNVDIGASLNPVQNLRNPSQLEPYSFKRKCEVDIYKTYKKTSLRSLYRALNKTSIANPKRVPASTKLRRYLRANQTFTLTHKELAETLGTCTKTAQRAVRRAVKSGDIKIVAKVGNNKRIRRTTEYTSTLYLEPEFSERTPSINTINSLQTGDLLRDFKQKGTSVGLRQKTIFALGLFLKHRLGKQACIEAIRAGLEGGAMRCHVSEREFGRTLKNIMKPIYDRPLSLPKMKEWGLLENRKITEISLH